MKYKILICLWAVILLLCGCKATPTAPVTSLTANTTVPTVLPTETAIPTTAPTEPADLITPVEGLSADQLITYFSEVCLDEEYSYGGDATLVQKWAEPIYYRIWGDCTPEDRQVLVDFTAWLNTIPGFPGIYEAPEDHYANLAIHFRPQSEITTILDDNFSGSDGGVRYWYDDENRIYDAIIFCRSDMEQHIRNSVILEEIYNGLGAVNDTQLREDSIIYAEYTTPQALTEIDRLILALLYHPDIQCGMDAQQCAEIIRELYS